MPRRAPEPTATGSTPFPRGDENFVYRAYCQCGDLLYIGVTNNLYRRITHHQRNQAPWTRKPLRLEWEVHPTREAGELAERRQIQTLHPLYNDRMSVPRPPRTLPLPWPRAWTEEEKDACAIAAYRGVPYLEWAWSTLAVGVAA